MHHQYLKNNPKVVTFYKSLVTSLFLFLAMTGQTGTIASLTVAGNSNGEAIQAALDQFPQGGDIVLGPGKYEIRQPIMLRCDNQVLRGSGPSTILFLADKANCPVVILGSPLSTPVAPRRICGWPTC